jgi:hypothetical protein
MGSEMIVSVALGTSVSTLRVPAAGAGAGTARDVLRVPMVG